MVSYLSFNRFVQIILGLHVCTWKRRKCIILYVLCAYTTVGTTPLLHITVIKIVSQDVPLLDSVSDFHFSSISLFDYDRLALALRCRWVNACIVRLLACSYTSWKRWCISVTTVDITSQAFFGSIYHSSSNRWHNSFSVYSDCILSMSTFASSSSSVDNFDSVTNDWIHDCQHMHNSTSITVRPTVFMHASYSF